MKSAYREPKYSVLINKKPMSKHTKSINLYLHLFLIEYDDPEEIPFDKISDVSGDKPNKIRALLRSVNNQKIFLGLVDIGVDPQDIPDWYARPKFIKKIVKKAQAKVVEKVVKRPARSQVVTHPLDGITLPSTYRTILIQEDRTDNYYDAGNVDRPVHPIIQEYWDDYLAKQQEKDRVREEKRKREEQAKRPRTPEELIEIRKYLREFWEAQNKMYSEAYLIQEISYNFKAAADKAAYEKDRDEALKLLKDTIANVGQELCKMRTPPPSTKTEPFVLPSIEDKYEPLRDLKKQKDKEKKDGFLELVKLGRDIQEKNRQDKQNRQRRNNAKNRYVMEQTLDYLNRP